MAVFSKNDPYTRAYERQAAQRRAGEQAIQERADREDAELRARVRADLKAKAASKAAEAAKLAAMDQRELAAYYHEQSKQVVAPPPPTPTGYFMALEAIRAEDRAAEREQHERRERKLGLPKARELAEREGREADTQRDEALAKLRAEHEQACEAVRDRCRMAHEMAQRPVKALEAKLDQKTEVKAGMR